MKDSRFNLSRRGLLGAAAGLAAAPMLAATAHAVVAPAGDVPLPNGSGFYRFNIGSFRATVVSDGYGSVPVAPIFAMNRPAAEVATALKENFMRGELQGTSNVLVVDTGRERILVDTGWGETIGPSFGNLALMQANLRRAGITAESIDLVVISHGHLDHIGGLVTKSNVPAFPNARIVFVDTEWNYWTGSRYESDVAASPMPEPFKTATVAGSKNALPAIASRTKFVKQGGEIAPGIRYIATPGHSPSHASILFESGGDQLIYLGDIAHHPVTSLQHPDWTPVFDYDGAKAIKTRKSMLDRVATDKVLVMNYHFPFPAIGHVVRHANAYRWEAAAWEW